MIGGSGSFPEKIARTKSRPGIAAIVAAGVTPYWLARGAGASGMGSSSL
jgi:hypothetical protein